jgi:hypothetical protein
MLPSPPEPGYRAINSSESLKFSQALQFDNREIRPKFNLRGTTRKRQPEKREGPCGLPCEACLSAGNMLVMFSTKAPYARNQACSLDILEKGKPVARPGRKA